MKHLLTTVTAMTIFGATFVGACATAQAGDFLSTAKRSGYNVQAHVTEHTITGHKTVPSEFARIPVQWSVTSNATQVKNVAVLKQLIQRYERDLQGLTSLKVTLEMQGISHGGYHIRHSKTSSSGLIFRTEGSESKRFVTNKLSGVFQLNFPSDADYWTRAEAMIAVRDYLEQQRLALQGKKGPQVSVGTVSYGIADAQQHRMAILSDLFKKKRAAMDMIQAGEKSPVVFQSVHVSDSVTSKSTIMTTALSLNMSLTHGPKKDEN